VGAVIVSSVRQPAEVRAGSPEALVQRYLQAVADSDRAAIRDTYTPELQRRCNASGAAYTPSVADNSMSFEADLVSTHRIDPDTVEVRVRISEYSGDPPFGGGGYTHTEVFAVAATDSGWGLAQAVWPYNVCPL
jgi:hypothetical protein